MAEGLWVIVKHSPLPAEVKEEWHFNNFDVAKKKLTELQKQHPRTKYYIQRVK